MWTFNLAAILFFCNQTQLLARTMVFSIKNCGSFHMENQRVCRCPSRRGIFLTRLMCLIKVDNSVTNGKSKSKRKQTELRHVSKKTGNGGSIRLYE